MKTLKKQIKQKNNPFKVGSEVFIKLENDGGFEGLVRGISDGFIVVKEPLNTQPLSYRDYKINITKILYFYEKS